MDDEDGTAALTSVVHPLPADLTPTLLWQRSHSGRRMGGDNYFWPQRAWDPCSEFLFLCLLQGPHSFPGSWPTLNVAPEGTHYVPPECQSSVLCPCSSGGSAQAE